MVYLLVAVINCGGAMANAAADGLCWQIVDVLTSQIPTLAALQFLAPFALFLAIAADLLSLALVACASHISGTIA